MCLNDGHALERTVGRSLPHSSPCLTLEVSTTPSRTRWNRSHTENKYYDTSRSTPASGRTPQVKDMQRASCIHMNMRVGCLDGKPLIRHEWCVCVCVCVGAGWRPTSRKTTVTPFTGIIVWWRRDGLPQLHTLRYSS
eukprot:571786-Amphidinium_carterae.1